MTPRQLFDAVWARADMLAAIHAYMSRNATAALQPDEILRAEWVARVSALDLYVHELVAQRMLSIFSGALPKTEQFMKFRVTAETSMRIRASTSTADAAAAFDLDVRQQLSVLSFQMPEKIADAVRYCSSVELWNEVALQQGATEAQKSIKAKDIKKQLSLIAERRNKIAHEGDLQPTVPRVPWPINETDLVFVREFIAQLVDSIDSRVV